MEHLSNKFKSQLSNKGDCHSRMFQCIFENVPFVIFDALFLIDNGKIYNEIIMVQGIPLNAQLQVNIVKSSNTKYTTRCDNGFCPQEWFNHKFNNGQVIEEITPKLDKVRPKFPEITYMIDSGNIIIDSFIKWNSPGSQHNHWQSLI